MAYFRTQGQRLTFENALLLLDGVTDIYEEKHFHESATFLLGFCRNESLVIGFGKKNKFKSLAYFWTHRARVKFNLENALLFLIGNISENLGECGPYQSLINSFEKTKQISLASFWIQWPPKHREQEFGECSIVPQGQHKMLSFKSGLWILVIFFLQSV